jgi:methylated-DNA-[protein]-cysteine S-methyltransferase
MPSTTPLYSTTHRTPVGELTLIASDLGLRAIHWPKSTGPRTGGKTRTRRDPDHPMLRRAAKQLNEYFDGKRVRFDIPLDLQGTRFQVAAWRALAEIPFGSTTSYGQQARAIGVPTAARALGAANRVNPVCIILPCHRVIGANGKLIGFAGGLQTKQWLLDHEAAVLAARASTDTAASEGAAATIPSWASTLPSQARLSMPVA